MQLPKYKKKKRIKLKVCQEPGCGREFWGHPIAKYCELHRDIKQRQKQKKDVENIESKNIIFRHNYTEAMDLDLQVLPRRLQQHVHDPHVPEAVRVPALLHGTQKRLQACKFPPNHAEKVVVAR